MFSYLQYTAEITCYAFKTGKINYSWDVNPYHHIILSSIYMQSTFGNAEHWLSNPFICQILLYIY
jgi:hypothetical protein